MSDATPRLKTRPRYPPAWRVALRSARSYVRDAVLGVVLVRLFGPAYVAAAQAAKSRGVSDVAFFALGSTAVHTACLAAFAVPFLVFDAYGLFERYKLPRRAGPSRVLRRRLVVSLVVNHGVTTPVSAALAYPVFAYCGMPPPTAPVPTAGVAWAMCVAHLINELGFYWSHRALHSKLLYKRVHARHHAFVATIAPAAEFASFGEALVSNTAPSILGCLLFGRHLLVFWVWLALRLQQTYEVHSGYAFHGALTEYLLLTQADAAIEHDHHHAVNRGCFGALWLDYLCGTMDAFVAAGGGEAYRRRREGFSTAAEEDSGFPERT